MFRPAVVAPQFLKPIELRGWMIDQLLLISDHVNACPVQT